jgi:hypothetical protein
MPGRLRQRLLLTALLIAAPALGDDARARAREAYDRGTAAHKRGDFAQAAVDYALADEMAPSPVALRAAIDEAVRADDAALGMELVARAGRAPAPSDLAKSVAAARTKFQGKAGVVRLRCPSTCMATLDGKPLAVNKDAWSTVGQHTVVIQVGDDAQQRLIEVKADAPAELAPTPRPQAPPAATSAPPEAPAPAPAPLPAPERPRGENSPAAPAPYVTPAPEPAPAAAPGLSPVWFFVGAGATLALGAGSALSALDTSSKHDDFVKAGCDARGSPACDAASTNGESAQARTNILLAVTAVVGVVTVVIGAAFTRWSSAERPAQSRTAAARPGAWYIEF